MTQLQPLKISTIHPRTFKSFCSSWQDSKFPALNTLIVVESLCKFYLNVENNQPFFISPPLPWIKCSLPAICLACVCDLCSKRAGKIHCVSVTEEFSTTSMSLPRDKSTFFHELWSLFSSVLAIFHEQSRKTRSWAQY